MEILEMFNEKNELVGTAPRSEVHRKGLFHRAVDVFIVNSNGRVFLHKRTESKDVCPGMWGMSVGEHLKPGESYREAAARGLKEEVGILDAKLTELKGPRMFRFAYEDGSVDNEFNSLFLAETDSPIIIDEEEIAEGRFFTLEEVEMDIEKGEKKFTPVFLAEWEEFRKLRK